ncbi:hypothetical protein TNCV_2854331 [Trichonephila clavipes]|uniref:Uncharacterized protein n=1 Tax=Trichonephila clavipes TaxID=2585209 RepID=A0A8X6R6Q4_TRICX|nr:hypothetical protein TNCV_2854331 [Trichonephila clavipes]
MKQIAVEIKLLATNARSNDKKETPSLRFVSGIFTVSPVETGPECWVLIKELKKSLSVDCSFYYFVAQLARFDSLLDGVRGYTEYCLQVKDGRDFWKGTGDEKWVVTIIPSAENHGDIPAMLPRRRPNRIFTVPRSRSVFGGTSSA